MKPKRLKLAKRFIVYLLVRCIVGLLQLLPLRFALCAGAAVGRLAGWIATQQRLRAERQLRESLLVDGPTATRMTRDVFANVGRVAAEIALLPRIRRHFDSYVELPETARVVLEEAHREGKGVLFISAHLGNWELLAQRLTHAGFDAATFARKGSNPYLADWLIARRREGQLETIARGESSAPRAIISALRRGAFLGALIDQDTRVDSVHVPFFGKPAATPVAPVQLAIRSNLPVIAGFITRKPDGFGHQIHVERVHLTTDDRRTRAQNAHAATAQLTAVIEAAIRRSPEEWVWFHARWER